MNDVQSLIFYLLAFSVATLFFYLGSVKRYSKGLSTTFTLVGLSIPVLLCGFRYYVGLDYGVYLALYNNISSISMTDILFDSNGIEVLFGLLSLACKTLFNNPVALFMTYSLMTVGFFYAGIRKLQVKYPWLLYLLFLLVIFPLSFNIMKQALSMSIVFFALTCAMNREVRKSILLTLVAMLSHMSAIVALPFVFVTLIWRRSLSTDKSVRLFIKYTMFLIALGTVFYLGTPLMLEGGVVDKYSDLYGSGGYYADSEASPIRILLKVLVIGFILIFYRHFSRKTDQFNVLFLFALSELLLLIIGLGSAPISRIALYLLPFALVILSSFPGLFRRGVSECVAMLSMVLFGIIYFVTLYYVKGGSGIFPYNFWLGTP